MYFIYTFYSLFVVEDGSNVWLKKSYYKFQVIIIVVGTATLHI